MGYAIYSIEGNRQRLDGGSMFGNVPHGLWSRWISPDQRLRVALSCRGFLIHDRQRDCRILLDTGIGAFFEPRLRDRYGVEQPQHCLLTSLAARGVHPEQIDFVVLSHLHFDHAGGLLTPWKSGHAPQLVFPAARFVVNRRAWQRAVDPHPRDRASFIPDIQTLLDRSGRLELVDDDLSLLGPDFGCTLSDGHTPGLLLTWIRGEQRTAVFCGDLIPGLPWVHLPVSMGYDRYPELLIDEKAAFLPQCRQSEATLLLTHDPQYAACRVVRDASGRWVPMSPERSLDGLIA